MMTKKAFTLIELLVVIAIIALLVSILLPSLSTAKELARRAVCSANLHNAGAAVQLYGADNDACPPPQYGSYTAGFNTNPVYFNEQYAGDQHSFITLPYRYRTILNVPWWDAMGQYLGGGNGSSEKAETVVSCPAKEWDATSWLGNNSYHWWGWTNVNVTRRSWWAGKPRGTWNVNKITYNDAKMIYADDLLMSDICAEMNDGSTYATHAGTKDFSTGGNQLTAGGSVKWMNFDNMCETPAVPVFSHIYGDFPE